MGLHGSKKKKQQQLREPLLSSLALSLPPGAVTKPAAVPIVGSTNQCAEPATDVREPEEENTTRCCVVS
jgi:hypothetical protein